MPERRTIRRNGRHIADHHGREPRALRVRRLILVAIPHLLRQRATVWLLGALIASSALAQQASPPVANVPTPQDLAKSAHNPFEDSIKLPLQSTTGFNLGPNHNAGESFNIEPLFPFRLTAGWDLIAQPNLTLTYLPSPNEQFGLEDLQTSFFLTPHRAVEWLWGIGPILQFPTATTTELGTGRWSAGPTGAVIYSAGPWFEGVLAYQLMSFAGDRNRGSVNETFIEPNFSYNFESGWYVDTNPSITFDWTADSGNGWTVPAGADVGKAFHVGSQGMSVQIGSYDAAKRPQGTPQWVIRLQLTLLFPT
jgi:hypothetical protein